MTFLLENRELLDGFRRGDTDALEKIYRRYAEGVARYLLARFALSTFDLHDTVQTTFLKAFDPKARESYDGLRPYGSWLIRIAHNVALNDLNHASKRFEYVTEEDERWEACETQFFLKNDHTPGQEVKNAEISEMLKEFLAKLDDEERKVVEARFENGWSQSKTALELGVTRRRIRTLEKRIRRKAAKEFARSGYLDGLAKCFGWSSVLCALLNDWWI